MFSRVPTDFNPDSTYINYPVIPQRTRVGATTYDPEEIRQYLVSIHAPVWVRPRTPEKVIRRERVSIHAPVWVRLFTKRQAKKLTVFQFTHPCGCDEYGERDEDMRDVSIHAPVWVRPA